MNQIPKLELTDESKKWMKAVIDDHPPCVPIVYQLSKYRTCLNILKWLFYANIKGKNLVEWLKINHENSILGMVKFIQMHHNKDKEKKPIILGKDWG